MLIKNLKKRAWAGGDRKERKREREEKREEGRVKR